MKRIFGLTAALLLSAVAGLWAQNTPAGILESPQSTSSQGRYRSTADNFIRTDAYGDVKFDKFFAYTSFYPGSTSRASLGFATKVGSAYLGLYYGGNFWSGIQPWNSTEVDQDFKDAKKTFPTYTTAPEYSNANTTTDNRFAVLIGAANMGFRLSYASTYQSFKGEDIYDSTNDTFFKSHETDFGIIAPQIEWSMAKDLTEKNGVRPKISVNLNFVRDYSKSEIYDPSDGSTSGEGIGNSRNYFNPHIVVNPGGYHVYNKDGFRATVDLDYELSLRMYDNEYSYVDNGKYNTKNISGLNNKGTLSEESWTRNLFTPSLAGQWSGGPFALRFKLNLPLEFTNIETTPMSAKADGSLEKNGTYVKTDAFMLDPNLRLAMQWKVVPDKLNLNAGGRINFGTLIMSTSEGESYTNGTKNDNSSYKTTNNAFGTAGAASADTGTSARRDTGNQLTLGATLMPSSNVTFEANCGVSGNNSINVFRTDTDGGLFSFGSVLVSLRY